jgi:hypothetical protein
MESVEAHTRLQIGVRQLHYTTLHYTTLHYTIDILAVVFTYYFFLSCIIFYFPPYLHLLLLTVSSSGVVLPSHRDQHSPQKYFPTTLARHA